MTRTQGIRRGERSPSVSPASGTPIRIDVVPAGFERVDPPEAVTVLLHPDDLRGVVGGRFEEINANVCRYQPFFASAEEAEPWLAGRPPRSPGLHRR
jgi:hypothetical protein